jgi:hypothetical protein
MKDSKKHAIDRGVACKIEEDAGARFDEPVDRFYEDADAE